MATRKTIRENFYTELKDSLNVGTGSELVAEDDIGVHFPRDLENLPYVVYTDDYRRLRFNGAGGGPHEVERSGGQVDNEVFYEYMEAQFRVHIAESTETAKEDIYEAVRSHFQKFQFRPWDPRDVQSDMRLIEVQDSTSQDQQDVEDTIYTDVVVILITFVRKYSQSGTNITQVNLENDADLDSGTAGENYTVT